MDSFKWACLGIVSAFLMVIAYEVHTIRVNAIVTMENSQQLIENSEEVTEVAVEMAGNIKALKDLAGLTSEKDAGRLGYATSIIEFIDQELSSQDIKMGVDRSGLPGFSSKEPLEEWLSGASTEAAIIVLAKAKTLEQVFYGLCQTFPGNNDFYIIYPDNGPEPIKLSSWLIQNHEQTQVLLPELEISKDK
jgi:hypothetical protein